MGKGRISAGGSRTRGRRSWISQVRIFSVVALLAVVIGLLAGPVASFAGAEVTDTSTTSASSSADQAAAPTVQSDRPDYAPGERVTLTGSNWLADESVHIVVNDDVGQMWSHEATVQADAAGTITYEFDLPSWFIATYSVTATGSNERVAKATFTDTDPNATTSSDPETTTTAPPASDPAPAPSSDPEPPSSDPAPPSSDPAPTTDSEPTATTTAAAPTIQSDKADYFPGERVTLTGTNWLPDDSVHIVVNDDANQSWKRDVHVQADATGNVVDVFNLPDWFVALYSVTATGSDGRVATTTFTDAPPKITAKNHEGQEKPEGTYTDGNVNTYREGDRINFRFTLTGDGVTSGQLQVRYTENDGSCVFFDEPFTLGFHDSSAPAITPVSGVNPTVNLVGSPSKSGGEWVQTLNVSFSGAGEAVVNYYLELSDQAGECNGASQHSRLSDAPSPGDVANIGQQNTPVPANQVIELPEITVIKKIDRDADGSFESTAAAGEFCFTLDSGSCVPTNASGQVVFTNVTPDGPHTVTETQLVNPGTYPFVSGSGTNCTFNGSTATATVASGETATDATCTFNNGAQKPHLKLVKTVTNDNGGTAQATAFTLSAAGPTPLSGPGGAESDVNPGTYTLSETSVAGYTAGSWSCMGGTFTGPDKIALAVNQSATCTIDNDDRTAHLKLVKTVTNDDGGTAVATAFTLSANGPTPISGAGGAESDVNAGTYDLSETGPDGYSAGDWLCDGGSQDGASVTLAPGESATCTIDNDDRTAHLKLVKTVTNDNGGTAQATAFTLSANGPTPISGAGGAESDVDAGTYDLSETGPDGYSAGDWLCDGGSQDGAKVTLALGESATCTIDNDDIAPKLHLVKEVVNDNGGDKTEAEFTLTANGTGDNDLSGTSPVDSGATLQADTWALSETNVYGYSASAWVCVGGNQNGSSITVGIGGEATCTITNDDQPGTIIVKKLTKPSASSTSFPFQTTGTGYNGFNLAGGAQDSQSLSAGSYTVKELVPLGWVLTGIGGSTDPNAPYDCTVTGSGGSTGVGDLNTQTATVSLKNGDTVTCLFENTGQGVTRTQGFWATHPQLSEIAWFGGTAFGHTFPGVPDTTLCGRSIDTPGKLTGGFWSDVSKKTMGAKRSALDQARMQLLQQLLAAELNASAFGSVPSSGSIAAWESAYCGTNQNAIKNAQQQAASFNSQGDSSQFTPGTSADSKNARAIANKPFWDTLP
jgi:hypothetical protein